MPDAPIFNFNTFAELPILDGHVHVWADLDPEMLWLTIERTGAQRCNVLSLSQLPVPAGSSGTLNAQALQFKQWSQGRAFAFGALDYSPDNLTASDLVGQAQRLTEQGFDGIKMWEGKPVMYVNLPDHLEGKFYAPFWAWVEEHQFPITMHMADPLRFWDPARAGLERWSYVGAEYPSRDEMFAETERILNRHPRLKIIFAHFLFFWDDLPRAARFLDAHPSVAFDLTPGVAGYFELSQNVEAAREFFLRYQDRMIYGTDVGAGPVVDPALALEIGRESGQAWIVRAFLETNWDIPIPAGVGAVTNAFAGRRLRGIALPHEVLEKIYWRNLERMVGEIPRMINL
jgi:predicted TIM-barrel fold metal-dependent hydrolase